MAGKRARANESLRQPQVFLVCGRNGSGKTTLARALTARHRRPCIVSPSGEWGEWAAEPWSVVAWGIRQACDVIVLDDCDAYLPARPDMNWTRLLSTNRHIGCDVLLLTRRPQDLPVFAVAAASRAYLLPLGPRERAWCESRLGASPPQDGHSPVIVQL